MLVEFVEVPERGDRSVAQDHHVIGETAELFGWEDFSGSVIAAPTRERAFGIAGTILAALDYVGVIGVELFVSSDGLIVNEIAPRVHNSGHWTQNGCAVDQFEQHIRAVAGWPLGDGTRHVDVVMQNLIGDDVAQVMDIATEPDAAIHLYGKTDVKPGRKMGHVNRVRQ